MPGHEITECDILFARKLATKFYRETKPRNVEYDDVRAAAFVGLCEAAKRFDAAKGERFSSFAFIRIRGSMYDLLRKSSASLNDSHENYAKRVTGACPGSSSHGTAKRRSFSAPRTYEFLGLKTHRNNFTNAQLELSYSHDKTAEELYDNNQMKRRLCQLITTLSKTEQSVVKLKYFYDKSYEEIGSIMGGRSKAWVSGIHRRAVDALELSLIDELQPNALAFKHAA